MSAGEKLKAELHEVTLYTALFAAWFLSFLAVKTLILAEYDIRFAGASAALVAALVLAKVVLLLERVPVDRWLAAHPAWIAVALRTLLYAAGVFLVLLLEKAFEVRHEQGGVLRALAGILRHEDIPHVIANGLCAAGALLAFNLLMLFRKRLGRGTLLRILASPPS